MKKNICQLLAGCLFASSLAAQTPQAVDLPLLNKDIPVIPPTIEALHRAFTRQTTYGDKFIDAELLNPVYEEVKQLLADLHAPAIKATMNAHPRTDMPDSVYFEDLRWKLALRPPVNKNIITSVSTSDTSLKRKLYQLIELQQAFDWQSYYKEYDRLEKTYQDKENVLPGENNLEKVRKKLALQQQLFEQQRKLCVTKLDQYTAAFNKLQTLLEHAGYQRGNGSTNAVQKLLTDVQARALESIEKLVWKEMLLVQKAELLYADLQVLSTY